MNRRDLLGLMLATCTAPAFARAASIMRVRPVLSPGASVQWVEVPRSHDLRLFPWAFLNLNYNGTIYPLNQDWVKGAVITVHDGTVGIVRVGPPNESGELSVNVFHRIPAESRIALCGKS